MQRVRQWHFHGKPSGVFLVRAIPTVAVLLLLVRAAIPVFHLPLSNPPGSWTWSASWNQLLARKELENQLKALPGQQLMIVHYAQDHDPKETWVSNSADIDASKIVWAHDMGAQQNEELLHYFSGRQAWLVNPDRRPIQLVPYKAVGGNGQKMPN
jgi:hypothetical protein